MISNACTRIDIGASAGSVPPSAHPSLICGVSDEIIQVSITSGSAASSAGPAGRARIQRRLVGERVDRQVLEPGQDRSVARGAEPDRERHPVPPLPGDVPVPLEPVDPVLEPAPHEGRDPLQLGRAGPEPVGVLPHRDEPLRPDLELDRRLAPLVHPDHLTDRHAGDQQPGLVERLDDRRPGLRHGQPGERPGQLAQAPVRLHHQAQIQVVAPPPQHVLAVTERAHHHQPGPVLRVHVLVGPHRHVVAEQRHSRRGESRRTGDRPDGGTAPRRPAAAQAGWSRSRARRRT